METTLTESATVVPISTLLYTWYTTVYIFPLFQPLILIPRLMSSCPPHTCLHAVTHLHTHEQLDNTALILACEGKHEAVAAELMEATKLAGALDLQVPHEAGQGGCVV